MRILETIATFIIDLGFMIAMFWLTVVYLNKAIEEWKERKIWGRKADGRKTCTQGAILFFSISVFTLLLGVLALIYLIILIFPIS